MKLQLADVDDRVSNVDAQRSVPGAVLDLVSAKYRQNGGLFLVLPINTAVL